MRLRSQFAVFLDALVDDDHGAFYANGNPPPYGTGKANGWFGGTNIKRHLVPATYSLTDFPNFTFACYLNNLIIGASAPSARGGNFIADLNWEF